MKSLLIYETLHEFPVNGEYIFVNDIIMVERLNAEYEETFDSYMVKGDVDIGVEELYGFEGTEDGALEDQQDMLAVLVWHGDLDGE
jgi:hypothetical protein